MKMCLIGELLDLDHCQKVTHANDASGRTAGIYDWRSPDSVSQHQSGSMQDRCIASTADHDSGKPASASLQ
jgi:hypothetical protein